MPLEWPECPLYYVSVGRAAAGSGGGGGVGGLLGS